MIDKCPHCGSDLGLYTISTYKNVICRIGFDGEEHDNSNMYENCIVENGNNMYCQHCDKIVFRRSTFEKQFEKMED